MKLQTQKLINDYLYFGYLPCSPNFAWVNSNLDWSVSYDYSVEEASALLCEVFKDSVKDRLDVESFIVPVSGGWDSRILLGLASENLPKSKIVTVTFGAPGQLDYDMGIQVADFLSLPSIAVDLNEVEVSWSSILNSVRIAPWTYVPDAYFNQCAVKRAGGNAGCVVSGFLGDPLTGGHLYTDLSWSAAKNLFVKGQQRARRKCLTTNDYSPYDTIPESSEKHILPAGAVLDLVFRQSRCIAPIVLSGRYWTGWNQDLGKNLITPFTDSRWAQYWLRAPLEMRKGQRLYLEVMEKLFPSLASLPSKYSLGGHSLNGIRWQKDRNLIRIKNKLYGRFPVLKCRDIRMINYLDFDRAFRERDDYKGLLNDAKIYLKESNVLPWIDLESLITAHFKYKANNGDVFWLLIGLAANLALLKDENELLGIRT